MKLKSFESELFKKSIFNVKASVIFEKVKFSQSIIFPKAELLKLNS